MLKFRRFQLLPHKVGIILRLWLCNLRHRVRDLLLGEIYALDWVVVWRLSLKLRTKLRFASQSSTSFGLLDSRQKVVVYSRFLRHVAAVLGQLISPEILGYGKLFYVGWRRRIAWRVIQKLHVLVSKLVFFSDRGHRAILFSTFILLWIRHHLRRTLPVTFIFTFAFFLALFFDNNVSIGVLAIIYDHFSIWAGTFGVVYYSNCASVWIVVTHGWSFRWSSQIVLILSPFLLFFFFSGASTSTPFAHLIEILANQLQSLIRLLIIELLGLLYRLQFLINIYSWYFWLPSWFRSWRHQSSLLLKIKDCLRSGIEVKCLIKTQFSLDFGIDG